jgi:GH15 family glucan-1,4-alpha-glucosidase
MRLEHLGLVGNCQYAALIERSGAVVWCCLPQFDSEPIFGELLDPDGGSFLVGSADERPGSQRYLDNTNVLETRFDAPGGRFRILDFAPRFQQHARMFRPTQIFRLVEPLEGSPRIVVRCNPVLGWTKARPTVLQGSNHLRYEGYASPLRLTTDIPLSYLDGRPFTLTGRHRLALTWGSPIEEPLPALFDHFLSETMRYWQGWVKECDIPPNYQRQVIRSALALKLNCFEDTGAIVAAPTTSIAEAPGSKRTWDYRYCWLRDAYYVIDAFRLLGHFDERAGFINYALNVVGGSPDLSLAPLYSVVGSRDLPERIAHNWAGFNGDGPVRVGNEAALHVQHDIFGELLMVLSPIFLDERFSEERTPATLDLLLRLARKAIAVAGTPDRGIWEYRTDPVPQTFSSLMCWTAADRAAAIAERFAPGQALEFRTAANRIRDEIAQRAWSESRRAYVGAYGSQNLDAALLQMVLLRLFPRDDERLRNTVDSIWRGLSQNGWLMRYSEDDGFGRPTVAFVLCTFWLVEALALLGRADEARALMDASTSVISPLGLLSEDYDTAARQMQGNFPQAYSHVGFIRGAFAAAPRWLDVL